MRARPDQHGQACADVGAAAARLVDERTENRLWTGLVAWKSAKRAETRL